MAQSDDSLQEVTFCVVATDEIGAVLRRHAAVGDVVMIDIPIGLADSEPRACDLAARKLLRPPRASSVFPAPCRATLRATTYEEACRINFEASGRKISRQTFNILDKIRAVDRVMTPSRQKHVRECHPEVVFARLSAQGHGLVPGKRTSDGLALRMRLLEMQLGPLEGLLAQQEGLGRSVVATDDTIDALACLIAASHVAGGNAMVLPGDSVEHDSCGLRMEILA